jgi:hypothetical protein
MEVNSVADLMEFVEANCKQGLYLFRGQREGKPLLPRIARDLPGWKIPHLEGKILSDFKRRCPAYPEGSAIKGEWHLLAVAQHHRMATRLLDWTDNPLAALWFAVERGPVSDEHSGLQPGVVWVFHVFDEDIVTGAGPGPSSPFAGERTHVYQPEHITRTIVAQGAWFTVHKYIPGKQKFVPLENNKVYKPRLRALTVPPRAFPKLKEQLDRCGVNAASLFPDLRGLCDYLNAKWLGL